MYDASLALRLPAPARCAAGGDLQDHPGRRAHAAPDSRRRGQRSHRRPSRRKRISAKEAVMENMQASERYAKCIEVSKRIRWDIDRDVIRNRSFDFAKKFLPDGLSKTGELDFLGHEEKRLVSQIQGRTYANMFGLVERFIGPKIVEVSREHWLGDQTAFEALVRFTDEELKHQELFRRIESMIAEGMPARSEERRVG